MIQSSVGTLLESVLDISSRKYPEWRSKKKKRGRADASQRERSNRRKGARRAAARG